MAARAPVYVLRIVGRPDDAGIRALRQLLKALLRRHGFKCIELREEVRQ